MEFDRNIQIRLRALELCADGTTLTDDDERRYVLKAASQVEKFLLSGAVSQEPEEDTESE